jgi:hypothetical protein
MTGRVGRFPNFSRLAVRRQGLSMSILFIVLKNTLRRLPGKKTRFAGDLQRRILLPLTGYSMESGTNAKLQKQIEFNSLLEEGTKVYDANLDTLTQVLSFLKEHSGKLNGIHVQSLNTSIKSMQQLENRFQQTEAIKQYLKERKDLLKAELEKAGLSKEFYKYNKQLYYYSQQIKEYKEVFSDISRIDEKALSLVKQLPAFQQFMKSHSALAGLFDFPTGYAQNMGGLQTRVDIQQLLQQHISAGGQNAQSLITTNIQSAKMQLNAWKEKLNMAGGDPDMDLPEGFTPNDQKKKTFWKRLEYGTNLQTSKGNYWFVNTTDIGLSLGYRLNGRSTIGIGSSYKVGLGNGWKDIRFSSEGASVRSFLDYKIKGSFFTTAGFEYNYQSLGPTDQANVGQPSNLSSWTQSGLVGVTKIVSLKNKLFKKTKLQLLWDFLSYQQYPKTQALKFRVGYNF